MNKFIFLFILYTPLVLSAQQRLSKEDYKALQLQENLLKPTAFKIIQGITSKDRFMADSLFTRQFVTALKSLSFSMSFFTYVSINNE